MVGAIEIYTDLIKSDAYDEESMLEYVYPISNREIGEAIQVFIGVKKRIK